MSIPYDMQLQRGAKDDGSFGLCIGEPYFLHRALKLSPFANAEGLQEYVPANGLPALVKELENQNPGFTIVVTNGAKQAILASLYAYRKLNRKHVGTIAPYWPSFKTLTDLSGLVFVSPNSLDSVYHGVRLLAVPGNPYTEKTVPRLDIWDAVYASGVYNFKVKDTPEFKIKIESSSKRFGLSGHRVGWLITQNEEIADLAIEYMELHTSGVSALSQAYTARVLQMEEAGQLDKGFNQARFSLIDNIVTFWKYLARYVTNVEGAPDTGQGMFAWFQPYPDVEDAFKRALEVSRVRLLTGDACGGPASFYRMSMGHYPEVTEMALSRLQSEIEKQRNL